MKKYNVGIIGNGFVGKATNILKSKNAVIKTGKIPTPNNSKKAEKVIAKTSKINW